MKKEYKSLKIFEMRAMINRMKKINIIYLEKWLNYRFEDLMNFSFSSELK